MFTTEENLLWESGVSIGTFNTIGADGINQTISVRLTDHTFLSRTGENKARHGDIPLSEILDAVKIGFERFKEKLEGNKFMVSFRYPKRSDYYNVAICIRDHNKIQIITLISDEKNKSTLKRFPTIKFRATI
jgi:hypothetical protein